MIAYGHDLQKISNFFEENGINIDGKFIAREFDNLNVTGYLVFDTNEECQYVLTLLSLGNQLASKLIEEHNRYINNDLTPPINPDIKYDKDISLVREMKINCNYIEALAKCLELLDDGQFSENLCMSIYKVLAVTGQSNNAAIAVNLAIKIASANGQTGLSINDQMHEEKLFKTIKDGDAFKDYLKSISGQENYDVHLPQQYSFDALLNQVKY